MDIKEPNPYCQETQYLAWRWFEEMRIVKHKFMVMYLPKEEAKNENNEH